MAEKIDYTFTLSDLLQAATRGHRPIGEYGGYIGGEFEVLDTLGGAGNNGTNVKASLFALAVLSGNEDAVKWAADFVIGHARDVETVRRVVRYCSPVVASKLKAHFNLPNIQRLIAR